MDLQSIIAALRGSGGQQQQGQPAPPQGAGTGGNAAPQPLTGFARGAQAVGNPQAEWAYKNYVIDAQTNGQPTVPFEQWLQMQGQQ